MHQQIARRCDRPLPTPREAPEPPAYFTGREDLINQLKEALLGRRGGQAIALCGMGGIGKTTLAGIVARLPEVEERFSDGTFWVDLHATDAMAALDRVACTYGHDVGSQTTPDSRARAVRSILREKKTLIVLDNAWQLEEISALLPHTSTACALVTTGDENLANEIIADVISVTTLAEAEGVEFLTKLIGRGVDTETSNVCREITRLLGQLPLALELAGKRARKEARHAWFSWSDILDSLREERGRLDLGSKDSSVRATFNISYARLDDDGRSLFGWLGLLSPGDLQLGTIARVGDLEAHAAAETLSELTDLSLIQQIGAEEYSLHPLLHDFASEKSNGLEESMRVLGYQRACDYFCERAQQDCKNPKSVDEIRPVLRSHHYAVAARDKERARRVYPWFGAIPIPGFLKQNGHPFTLLGIQEAELSLAVGDAQAAFAEWALGESLNEIGRSREAASHLNRALELYEKEEYDLMVAKLNFILAQSYQATGEFQQAIKCFERSIEVDRRIGVSSQGEGLTLTQIGDCYLSLGENNQAAEYYENARSFSERNSNPRDEISALIRLASLSGQLHARAVSYLARAYSLSTGEWILEKEEGETQVIGPVVSGWDGARLLIQIGDLYQDLLFNEPPVLKTTVNCYWRAISMARQESPFYESLALYKLGNLLEHLFLIPGQESDYAGAIACYEMADKLARGMELPPGINPRERIETRIRTRFDAAEFAVLAENALNNAERTIQSAVQRVLLTDIKSVE